MTRQTALTYPVIFADARQRAVIEDAYQWLERDPLIFDGCPWAAQHIAKHAAALHSVEGYSFAGVAIDDKQFALSSTLLNQPGWMIASVMVHEASHLSWTKNHGTLRNSRREELSCLDQQRAFLHRIRQPVEWMAELYHAANNLPE